MCRIEKSADTNWRIKIQTLIHVYRLNRTIETHKKMKISDSFLLPLPVDLEIDNRSSLYNRRSALGLYFSRIRGFYSIPARISRLHSRKISVLREGEGGGEREDISRNISAVIPETDVSAVTRRANTVRTRSASVNLFLFGARSQQRYVK